MDGLLEQVLKGETESSNRELDNVAGYIRGGDFLEVLKHKHAQVLFGNEEGNDLEVVGAWPDNLEQRLTNCLEGGNKPELAEFYLSLAYTSLLTFIQANFTGPPLASSPNTIIFGDKIASNPTRLQEIRTTLLSALAVDGVSAYRLTPYIELLYISRTILFHPKIADLGVTSSWIRARCTFIHQRVLSESCSTLQDTLTDLYTSLENAQDSNRVEVLLERAAVETFYGNEQIAKRHIDEATRLRRFEFALTGRLGKRTKFQQTDISQLVVLARSHIPEDEEASKPVRNNVEVVQDPAKSAPVDLDLNDDTLLDSIAFSKSEDQKSPNNITDIVLESLRNIDPSDQPKLEPLDTVILLSLASSITNTSPADGLTREETLPYATRVLDGGSTNWQIYSQALLVRSRIEGYKSRTVERGLLQLQALVDQVIAETGVHTDKDKADQTGGNAFLPQAKVEESASVMERLRYVFQLAPPARWELEAELAQRWVQLGGLRSALEIYERLELWAEAALCLAATEQEHRARSMIRKLLYEPVQASGVNGPDQDWSGPERNPLPVDAPRLLCILGDLDSDITLYERAWEVSGKRYARAQRSIGRIRFKDNDFAGAIVAYDLSLSVNKLNQSSWFALGCALLTVENYERASEVFTRCIQLDDQDAESWSNLAAALLRRGPTTIPQSEDRPNDPQRYKRDALNALKRAASLKSDSYRIWENVILISASLIPPDRSTAIAAQSRIIDLRGKTDGDRCVDAEIMSLLVKEAVGTSARFDPAKPGPERMLVELFDRKIQSLITSSSMLWSLVAKLALWRNRPLSALDAHEKAWRCATNQPGWGSESQDKWNIVVDYTIDLCDAYESLGPMEVTEGLKANQGVVVAKDWKFKSKSALRGIMGKAKPNWEDSQGWIRLTEKLAELFSSS